jgi:hypothetical protein
MLKKCYAHIFMLCLSDLCRFLFFLNPTFLNIKKATPAAEVDTQQDNDKIHIIKSRYHSTVTSY